MYNITPEEVMQMDMDRLKSEMAEMRHDGEYIDILDRPPQLGCAYAIRILGKDLGSCLYVNDRPSTQPMFVSVNGNAPIGGIKEKTMLYSDDCMHIKFPDSYELDKDWMFYGLLFKVNLDSVRPHDVMLKLLK